MKTEIILNRRFNFMPVSSFLMLAWLCCILGSVQAAELYHTNRTFTAIEFNLEGIPSIELLNSETAKLTNIVKGLAIQIDSNGTYAIERNAIALGYTSATNAWNAAVNYNYERNHSGKTFDNVGWVRGTRLIQGEWGAYLWTLRNRIAFKSSATNIWVSSNGIPVAITNVMVGSLGDYQPVTDIVDIGPNISQATNFPGDDESDSGTYYADITNVYYQLAIPGIWITPRDAAVEVGTNTIWFTVRGTNLPNGVTWTIYPTNFAGHAELQTNSDWHYASVIPGNVATNYKIRVTSVDNTNYYDEVNFTSAKVEVEKCSSSYLPKGGSEDNTTTIRAYVTPSTVKGEFKFTLFDVSDEKGYCLNAPTNVPASGEDSDSWKDYQFPYQTGFTISGTDSNIAETLNNDLHESTVTIKSYDYGSFGKIKAEFTAQNDGVAIMAREVNGTNQYTCLPADTNGNCIADSWDGDTGPNGGHLATDDTDNLPTGNTGDGFTRYEEWRGFIVGGNHIRTSVTYRDLFIYDQNDLGFGYYPSGSGGIACHSIDNTEWTGTGKKADGKRIVNNNRDTAAGSTQYALHLIKGGSPTNAWGCAWGDPDNEAPIGPPNTCWEITIEEDAIKAGLPDSWETNYVSRTIAHEIGHGSAVPHHSPDAQGGNLCVMREPPGGVPTEETTGTSFCTAGDNCKSKIDVKDQ